VAGDPRDGSLLFGRVAKLTIAKPSGSFSDTDPEANTLVIGGGNDAGTPGLRIVAKISKSNQKEPNTGEITIYNLAPTTRSQLQQKGLRVLVEAGYQAAGLARIFLGDSRTTDHKRDGADLITLIKCGDGERALRYARASASFAAGATVAQVVQHCADAMGLGLGNVGVQLPNLQRVLFHGWTAHGAAASELERVLRAVGYRYSVQDGQVQILAPGQSLPTGVPLLSPQTGLIGSPEMGSPEKAGKPTALKFRSLLRTDVRPGGRVHLRSERYNAIFSLRKVVHTIDTMGGDWYTDFEAVQDPTATVT